MRLLTQLALASASIAALSTPAVAQQGAPADEGFTSGEIIVQARRRHETLQDVPLTVNAVSGETIEKLNIRDAKDITSVVPGLQLSPGNNVTGQVSSLRGLKVDVNASGNNGTVEFYQNDAPLSAGATLQAIYDIGQIEVLRGPQGTLRGRASPSGSITITTRRPDMNEWGGYVSGTVNTLNAVNINGAVNIPIIDDVLAVRVAGLFEDNEANRVYSLNNADIGPDSRTRSVRASVLFRPVDNLEFSAIYTHLVKDSKIYDQVESAHLATGGTLPAGSTLITARDMLAVQDMPHINHSAFDIFNWQAHWSFSGLSLDYVGSYIKQDLRQTRRTDVGNFFGSNYPGNATADPLTAANLQNFSQLQHTYSRQESHELRLSSDERLFGAVDFIVGAFVNKLQPSTDLRSPRPVFAGSFAPANFLAINLTPIARRGRQIERSLFGNLTVHLGDRTEVSGGVRYINYKENLNTSTPTSQGPSNSYNPVIWNASVKHRFSDDLMVYATAGSSWRIGSGTNPLILARSVNLATVTDPFLASLFELTPERSKSYEVGLKASLFDRRMTLALAAFHQDFSGYIFSGPSVFVTNNTGTVASPTYEAPSRTLSGLSLPVPAKVNGVEAEINYRPSSQLELGASFAYAKSKISNATVPCNPVDANGNPIPSPTVGQIQDGDPTRQVAQCTVNQSAATTSPFSATFRGEYSQPVTERLNAVVRGLVTFNGDNQNDPQNPMTRSMPMRW